MEEYLKVLESTKDNITDMAWNMPEYLSPKLAEIQGKYLGELENEIRRIKNELPREQVRI